MKVERKANLLNGEQKREMRLYCSPRPAVATTAIAHLINVFLLHYDPRKGGPSGVSVKEMFPVLTERNGPEGTSWDQGRCSESRSLRSPFRNDRLVAQVL